MWLDLLPYLPLNETNGDGWAAEKLLSRRLNSSGVLIDVGADYLSPGPGRFRVVFVVEEGVLREGVRR
jgi:hypothetical protein